MIRYTTVGKKKEQHFDKLYVLDHDVLENGSNPLAFSWPAKAFSKTYPVKVPKLEAWLIKEEELEQDHSKVFMMEDISDKDPETAYDLLVTCKQMPIPKELLDITWDGSLARKVLRLVIDRIKILSNSEEPEKISEVQEKVITLDFARLDLEDSIGDPPNKTYKLLTKTLAAVEESNKTTKTSVESLLEVVVAGIHGKVSDKAPPNTLAKCKKHKSIGIVQSLLDNEAKKLNLNLEFIVSAGVINRLVELEFCLCGNVEKGLNMFDSVCFQHYKNANAINNYNKSNYWLTASMKDYQAHNKIKHAIFPKDPMQFREMVTGMLVFYCVVFGETHPLTAVYKKFAKNVDTITQKMGVSQQERALKQFLFGIYSQIDRYFEHLVRSGTNAEENLPDLGTYVETCFHGGSLPESNLFAVAKDSGGTGGTGDKT
ncbi:unnamed protein product [Cylindrotheca closterium]|uniref:Uncharacterized protein n=1 Tax=Cylindrotheca closterium TaxID=2856 RepID=A0AAD2CPU1_9STRA|nr:unnamed protein product [Cylindrotheca closterium]